MRIQEETIYTPKETQEYLKVSQSTMTRMLKKGLIRSARIRKMKSLMKAAGLKPPVFKVDTFFRATFYRAPEYALKKVGEKVTGNQRRILAEIERNPYSSAKDLSLAVGISPRKIEVNLQKLKQKSLLKRIGPDKGGRWEVSA